MPRKIKLPLGYWLLFALLILGISLIEWTSATNRLSNGVTTQGVIVAEQGIICGRSTTERQSFSVRFTDQAGQSQVGTISQCDYDLNASPGDSITILYLPNNPTELATPDAASNKVNSQRFFTLILALITLILLLLWIRKRIRKPIFL